MDFSMDNGTLFSYVLNNYWFTNYQWLQSGDYSLRYAFTSGRRAAPDLRLRQALEIAHPLRAYNTGQILLEPQSRISGGKRYSCSILDIAPEQVYCVTIKGAEDGRGFICRLLNLADYTVPVTVSSEILKISGAMECNGDESDIGNLSLDQGKYRLSLGPHQLATVRLFLEANISYQHE